VTSEVVSFCRICPNACGVVVTVEGDRVARVVGQRDHPRTHGYTCTKGRALGDWHHHPQRLDQPLRRQCGVLRPVGWDACLDDLAGELDRVRGQYGADAIGVYRGMSAYADSLGQPVAARFFDALESASRYSIWTLDLPCAPYVAELVTGHPLLWAVPDEDARLVLLLGSNPMTSHGHAFALGVPRTTLRRWASQGAVWVVDPRRTATAAAATRHLAIRPGTDHALLAFLVRELLRDGADHGYLDRRASGVEALRDAVEPYHLERAARQTALAPDELLELLKAIRHAGRIAVHTGTGITMSRSANVSTWLVWALNIITASHDRPGGNRFDRGAMSGFERPPAAAVPRPGPASRPDLPAFIMGEYPCAALVDEIEAGNLRALIVLSGNPLTALPNPTRVARALERLEVLAVADVVRCATVEQATHVLACTGQLERSDLLVGGSIGTDAQYSPPVLAPAADRRPMWWIFAKLAERMGFEALPDGLDADEVTEETLLEVAARSAGRDLLQLRAERHAAGAEPTYGWVEAELPEGRWRLGPAELVAQLGQLPEDDPDCLRLVAGRRREAFNSVLADGAGNERPGLPAVVVLHPDDASSAGVRSGELVTIRGDHGSLTLPVELDPHCRRGVVGVSHGLAAANVNALTSERADVDRYTGMVRLTAIPVSVSAAPEAQCDSTEPQA
jgi:anaerobic selenocysteine-containing dehydrogenase